MRFPNFQKKKIFFRKHSLLLDLNFKKNKEDSALILNFFNKNSKEAHKTDSDMQSY